MPKVLVGPAPLREVEHVYGPALRAAGFELAFPKRNAQMSEAELAEQLPGCVASLAGSEPYTPAIIAKAAAAGLKVIARAGVGYDAVDVAAATEHGVAVCIAPGTNHDAVAEHTFALLLALARTVVQQNNDIKAGGWTRKVQQPVRGKTLGLLGLGRVGKAVALRGLAFGMPVVAHDPFPDQAFAAKHGIPLLPVDDVFKQADYLSLHMPMLAGSKHIINAQTLGLMKPTAYLINTARGGVVDECALYDALATRKLAGAGLDVFDLEPPGDCPLLKLDTVVATAHTAGVDMQSRDDMARVGAEAIVKLLGGGWPAECVVNPEVKAKWKA
jgi:D-3-phosphoglycerate dehydrogenase